MIINSKFYYESMNVKSLKKIAQKHWSYNCFIAKRYCIYIFNSHAMVKIALESCLQTDYTILYTSFQSLYPQFSRVKYIFEKELKFANKQQLGERNRLHYCNRNSSLYNEWIFLLLLNIEIKNENLNCLSMFLKNNYYKLIILLTNCLMT